MKVREKLRTVTLNSKFSSCYKKAYCFSAKIFLNNLKILRFLSTLAKLFSKKALKLNSSYART